ncbi:helicase C-terminal domain-containing protein [Methanobrevibacter curvatus]|uniref:Bifunctional ATP-dependent DNA helicase/DNA polymerase III subunit epsilon n=1 Tax=Methanobrevibacter curvatus TaxID=49547 RepID=A0A166DUT8_9EURY|nr:ATP-dependent DNA helicase [Methanobrevibacter curvatus]KZX15973.1 bifunctional ATP-dependent DNA helicase/DNA polymerase III subunit epsilon [Methanobrevibacter curvatus]
MSNSLFCPNCGMLKNNCVCSNNKSKKEKTFNNYDTQNTLDFSYPKKENYNTQYDKIDENSFVYSIEKNSLNTIEINKIKSNYPEIPSEIIEKFPFKHPRVGQLEILSEIVEAIEKGFKYIILEAGTGTGKSVIAATLARLYESSYILTMTKQLQSQYAEEFNFPLVKGRSNFSCLNDDLESTCDIGNCKTSPNSKKFFCPFGVSKNPPLGANEAFETSYGALFFNSENHCSYWQQKADSINSPISLMNYDYGILELNYVKHFPKRKLLILDEAHNIENKLMRILELNLYNKRLEKDIRRTISRRTVKDGEISDWKLEIEGIYEAYREIDLSKLSINKADRIRSTTLRLKQLCENLEKEPKNWVIDGNEVGVSFKPLKINQYAKNYLFNHGEITIFLSATILSHKLFSKWLGLNPRDVFHMKVDSPFKAHQRPIELKFAGKMSKNRINQTAPKTIPILNKILKKHENDKGLIHSNSYNCQHYITNHLHNTRIISHNSENRERILNFFEKSEDPLVLVSPSMSEGVDLPYDKCRFQIIYKVPFPYLGDKQINQRRKRDQRWYAYKTVMTLMQAYGRGMRAEDDECYTYIIDEDINILFKSPMYKSLLPEFFKEAIIQDD